MFLSVYSDFTVALESQQVSFSADTSEEEHLIQPHADSVLTFNGKIILVTLQILKQ